MKVTIARTVGIAAAVAGAGLLAAPTASAAPEDLTVGIGVDGNVVVMDVRYAAPGAVVCVMDVRSVDGTVSVATVGPTTVLGGDDGELTATLDPGEYTVQWTCSSVPSFEQWGSIPPLTNGTVEPTIVTVTETSGPGGGGSSGSPFGS
ncbi:hypothetical protein OPAG_04454 [Rhodococcus opacus PD630]|uniref:hypothetical protein n=1 Tax=Rhodococcus TaxID=1827 RepID=UPI00029CD4DA|nr:MULTISPECIES: hypothetical protein [Rhodococcus]KXF55645.1 hypothetical protein AXA44_04210 [Rhodococcus sp. SC4]AHK29626.1 hypothetical protein Pd630_LPD02403 [Rhodococcus opacus PD630]EHI45959.1 hypothetical protein OPAG_04454 [Rhodococcus opacus PD630]KXX57058.1 hypothetical protein AZG88_01555 [Rhodococcus sp. LB1]PBC58668.1 hypothetical protein CJ177_02165 [Rhodococcus sp. ACPA1]